MQQPANENTTSTASDSHKCGSWVFVTFPAIALDHNSASAS